jgi:hypothetical protein
MEHVMRTTRTNALGAILLAATAACGGDNGPAGPDEPGGNLLSATLDGSPWSAQPGTIVAPNAPALPGSLSFQGSTTSGGTARTVSIQLSRIPGPGTYPLGMNVNSATGGIATYVAGSQGWTTPLNGASGSITITEVGGTRVRGTFSFEAASMVPGSAPAVVATQGRFDVPLSIGFAAATPDQLGSTVSGTVGGGAWNASTVVGTSSQNVYSFTATNLDYTITATIGPVTGPGSSPLSSSVPLRRLDVQRAGGGAWGGTAADQGTLTITSLTAARITGSFSGTLAAVPAGSGAPPLTITNAVFDVRLGP